MGLIAEEHKKARMKAMRLLEHMDRTERGLTDRLRQEGFSEEAVENAVEYVKSFGYINDARYARNYISYRLNTKSKQQILNELYRKGIDRLTAREAWAEIEELEEPDERALLWRTAEKKCAPGEELDEKGMRRLCGYLVRRGFRQEDIFSVLEEMKIRKS